jgi:cytochrome c-type biogenesis protein CcmH/NrfG
MLQTVINDVIAQARLRIETRVSTAEDEIVAIGKELSARIRKRALLSVAVTAVISFALGAILF